MNRNEAKEQVDNALEAIISHGLSYGHYALLEAKSSRVGLTLWHGKKKEMAIRLPEDSLEVVLYSLGHMATRIGKVCASEGFIKVNHPTGTYTFFLVIAPDFSRAFLSFHSKEETHNKGGTPAVSFVVRQPAWKKRRKSYEG